MSTLVVVITVVLLYTAAPPTQLPELIVFLLGAFSSLIVQFVKGKFQSRTARFVLALLLTVITAVASYFLAKPEETDLVVFVIHVFAYSQLAYNMFWKVIWEEVLKFRKFGQYRG